MFTMATDDRQCTRNGYIKCIKSLPPWLMIITVNNNKIIKNNNTYYFLLFIKLIIIIIITIYYYNYYCCFCCCCYYYYHFCYFMLLSFHSENVLLVLDDSEWTLIMHRLKEDIVIRWTLCSLSHGWILDFAFFRLRLKGGVCNNRWTEMLSF